VARWTLRRLSKSKVKLRLAPPEVSARLTGYSHNAVSPVGLVDRTVPIVLSHHVAALQPDFVWLGGGEVDLKLGFNCQQFLHGYAVHAVDCTLDAAPANDLLDDDEL
jgi:prolyl-tRNA editing enzyme YbaK/EbsC (Cys-tRNA(Pro) deacylase)